MITMSILNSNQTKSTVKLTTMLEVQLIILLIESHKDKMLETDMLITTKDKLNQTDLTKIPLDLWPT